MKKQIFTALDKAWQQFIDDVDELYLKEYSITNNPNKQDNNDQITDIAEEILK